MEKASQQLARDARRAREYALRRRDITSAAETQFAISGYADTSMGAIAKEAGFSRRTMYNYFDSKDQLYADYSSKVLKSMNKVLHEINTDPTQISSLKDLQPALMSIINTYASANEFIDESFLQDFSFKVMDYYGGQEISPEERELHTQQNYLNEFFHSVVQTIMSNENPEVSLSTVNIAVTSLRTLFFSIINQSVKRPTSKRLTIPLFINTYLKIFDHGIRGLARDPD